MELNYSQIKSAEGRTIKQNLEVKDSTEEDIEQKRKKLVAMLSSETGITLPFSIDRAGNQETHRFVFNLEENFANKNPDLRGGYLVISLPESDRNKKEEIAGISYTLTKGKTSNEPTAFITDKGYIATNGKEIYGGLGLMKIAFSLLAEAFRENGIRKVEAYITGGNPAEKSRTNAPVLFSEGKTYADSSEEINTPSGPVLVTTL